MWKSPHFVFLTLNIRLTAVRTVAPLALTAHVVTRVVSESGAPRLAVISVHQRAARVLLVLVDEGKDTGRSTAGPSHCDAAWGRICEHCNDYI